jgi:type II secretory pathway pseudopilin PulG
MTPSRSRGVSRGMSLNVPSGASRGMTLLEVLAATAVLLATCLAVTGVTVTAARAGAQSAHVARADQVLQAEAARLRALPFFAPLQADWPLSRVPAAPSAVGELFPHADEALNLGEPGYVATGDLAGSYVSSVLVGDAEVVRAAWMARCDASGWRRLAALEVSGWQAWAGMTMPGEALVVRLETSAVAATATTAGSGAGTLAGAGAGTLAPTLRHRTLTVVLSADGRPGAVDPDALGSLDGEVLP